MFRKLALGLLIVLAASLSGASIVTAQSRMYGSDISFYNELAPYGRWIDNRDYGRVWIPNVERNFRPYATRGYWAMTDYGNTWVSDYDWGWAPFHYGRWTFDDYYGWIWIPGNEWAPAWVSWRSDNDNYGWAPLGPGIDIDINIHIPLERWIFVPKRYIVQRNVYDYCLPRQRVVYVYRNATVINNVYVNGARRYCSGPYRDDIEYYTRQKVNVCRVESNGRPGRMEERDGVLRVYRPGPSYQRSRDSRDGDKTSDYRSRDAQYGQEPSARNDNARHRAENYGNQERKTESRSTEERDHSQAERYRRQTEQRDRARTGPSQEESGNNRGSQSNSSGSPYERPGRGVRAEGSSTSQSGRGVQQNSGGQNREGGNAPNQSSSSGRSRPTRG